MVDRIAFLVFFIVIFGFLATYLGKAGFDPSKVKPYSIRLGGAAHHFSLLGNMALTCVRGHWRFRATANIDVIEGTAALRAIRATRIITANRTISGPSRPSGPPGPSRP